MVRAEMQKTPLRKERCVTAQLGRLNPPDAASHGPTERTPSAQGLQFKSLPNPQEWALEFFKGENQHAPPRAGWTAGWRTPAGSRRASSRALQGARAGRILVISEQPRSHTCRRAAAPPPRPPNTWEPEGHLDRSRAPVLQEENYSLPAGSQPSPSRAAVRSGKTC